MRSLFLILLAANAFAADLFRDDFSRFPPGWLSSPVGMLNGAIQEYHYLPNRGVDLGPWANAIGHLDAWVVSDEDGKPYLEQHLPRAGSRQFAMPIFVTGEPEWSDYTVEVRVKPLSTVEDAGVVFRYHTNRHYYFFGLSGGTQARLALHLPLEKDLHVEQWQELGTAPLVYDTGKYHVLRVENDGSAHPRICRRQAGPGSVGCGNRARAKPASHLPRRRASRTSRVTASDAGKAAIDARIRARDAELSKLRAGNPRPNSVEEVRDAEVRRRAQCPLRRPRRRRRPRHADRAEHPAGAGRCLRCHQLPHRGDARRQGPLAERPSRSRATACSPTTRRSRFTTSTATAATRFVLVRDFKLQILDGRTGEVKKAVPMPRMPAAAKERPYDQRERRFHRFRQSLRRQAAARDPAQGPLHATSGSSTTSWSCCGRATDRPATIPTRSTSMATAATRLPSAMRSGTTTASSSGATTRKSTTTPTASPMGNFSGDPKAEAARLRQRQRRGLHHVRHATARS